MELLDYFIVLEGLDGAGTTTQARMLADRLSAGGRPVWATSEPTHGAIGSLIRRVLSGSVNTTPEALAMLYAADRHEHVFGPDDGIRRTAQHKWVVCDRYLFSSLAYQTVQCDYSLVFELNRRFPLPRHLVYLDVSPELTEERRRERPAAEIFENLEFQSAVHARYKKALDEFSGYGVRTYHIDGDAPPHHISEQIWKQLDIPPIK
ncbi:MAG: dTMP kinase [Spirochaetaceae bacterium]